MKKLLKYEWKGKYRGITSILLIVVVGIFGLNISLAMGKFDFLFSILEALDQPVSSLPILLSSLPFLLVFLLSVSSFKNELEDCSSHMYFCLPIEEAGLLGSKLLASLIFLSSIALIILLGMANFTSRMIKLGYHGEFGNLFAYPDMNGFLFLISMVAYVINNILLAQFTIVISKLNVVGRRLGPWWLVLFLILNYCFDRLRELLFISLPLVFHYKRGFIKLTGDIGGYRNIYLTTGFININAIIISLVFCLEIFKFLSYALKNLLDI